MSYRSWFEKHGQKHRAIVDRLVSRGCAEEQILAYFDFENMVTSEPDFCPLYASGKKCHDVPALNCYLCACPLFRFDSDGISEAEGVTTFSYCHVNSKFGRQGRFGDAVHQDCSKCTVPHGRKYVSAKFDLSWFRVMEDCDLGA